VISGTDPLDGKDFNPVDYINALFPSEQVCLRLTIINLLLQVLFIITFLYVRQEREEGHQ